MDILKPEQTVGLKQEHLPHDCDWLFVALKHEVEKMEENIIFNLLSVCSYLEYITLAPLCEPRFNLLKRSCYYIYHQVSHSKILPPAHTVRLFFVWFLEQTVSTCLFDIMLFVFMTEA
jgi:hypothetical protein